MLTGDDIYQAVRGRPLPPGLDPALWAAFIGTPPRDQLVMPLGDGEAPIVQAYANHGRWVADCAFCSSAQAASPSDQRFYCGTCKNQANGHITLPIEWPVDRALIDELLDERPVASKRNWLVGETIADLARENDQHLGAVE